MVCGKYLAHKHHFEKIIGPPDYEKWVKNPGVDCIFAILRSILLVNTVGLVKVYNHCVEVWLYHAKPDPGLRLNIAQCQDLCCGKDLVSLTFVYVCISFFKVFLSGKYHQENSNATTHIIKKQKVITWRWLKAHLKSQFLLQKFEGAHLLHFKLRALNLRLNVQLFTAVCLLETSHCWRWRLGVSYLCRRAMSLTLYNISQLYKTKSLIGWSIWWRARWTKSVWNKVRYW